MACSFFFLGGGGGGRGVEGEKKRCGKAKKERLHFLLHFPLSITSSTRNLANMQTLRATRSSLTVRHTCAPLLRA